MSPVVFEGTFEAAPEDVDFFRPWRSLTDEVMDLFVTESLMKGIGIDDPAQLPEMTMRRDSQEYSCLLRAGLDDHVNRLVDREILAVKEGIRLRNDPSIPPIELIEPNSELWNELRRVGEAWLTKDDEAEREREREELAEERKKLEEERRILEAGKKELEAREKELDQKTRYQLMLHSSKETDRLSYLPGRKISLDRGRNAFYVSAPGVKIFLEGPLPQKTFPVKALKAFSWMLIELTAHRTRHVKDGEAITMTFDEWGRKRGLSLETTDQRTKARLDLLDAINWLAGGKAYFPYTEKIRPLVMGPDVVRNGKAIIGYEAVLANSVADALAKAGTCTYYPDALFMVNEHLPGAYSIGYAMTMHWFMYPNIEKGINSVLTMGSLYKDSFLPSIDDMKKNRQSWRKKVQEPINRALDHLKEIGLLESLEYDRDFQGPFEEWLSMRVRFRLKDSPSSEAKMIEVAPDKQITSKPPKKALIRHNKK